MWSLRWNGSSLTKNYVLKSLFALQPLLHLLQLFIFSEQWFYSTLLECLWRQCYGNTFLVSNQVLRLWRLKSLGGLWGNTWRDIQYQHLIWQRCTEFVLARGWNFTNTVHLRETGTSLSFIPWCNRNNCHDKSIWLKNNNLKLFWRNSFHLSIK